MNVFVLTISTSSVINSSHDNSGPILVDLISHSKNISLKTIHQTIVLDDELSIIEELTEKAKYFDVIITTGGTGLSPCDVTPEATKKVIQRECPGIVTALLMRGLESTPLAALSRLVAGFINFFTNKFSHF